MGTSGGWSPIQELVLVISGGDYLEPLSLREAEHIRRTYRTVKKVTVSHLRLYLGGWHIVVDNLSINQYRNVAW